MLIGFFAILFAAYQMTKFLGSKMTHLDASKYIKVIDRVPLGGDKSICIVQVGKHFYILGVTNHHVGNINEIAEADLVPLATQKKKVFNSLIDVYTSKNRQVSDKHRDDGDKLQWIKDDLERRKREMKGL